MKKFILIAAALFVGTLAKAQFVANGAFVHATEAYRAAGINENLTLDGFSAGANYYYSLDHVTDGLAFVPGLSLSFLWGQWLSGSASVSEMNVNVPLQASYTYRINENFKLIGQTGPALQLALSHKISASGTSMDLLNKENPTGILRSPFNLYWGFAGGVEASEQLRLEIGFDLGLLNLSKTEHVDKIRRNFLHIGIGYLF